MRKGLAGLALLMCVLINPAAAMNEEELHRDAAERLLVLMEMEKNLNEIIDQSLAMEFQQNPQLMLYKDVFKRFFSKYMSWESLKEDFITIYTEEFTADEINDLIEFYGSPTGKKAIEKTPVLFMKGAEAGQRKVQENLPELERMIEEETKRLKDLQEKEMVKQDGEEETPESGAKEEGE